MGRTDGTRLLSTRQYTTRPQAIAATPTSHHPPLILTPILTLTLTFILTLTLTLTLTRTLTLNLISRPRAARG